MTIIVSVAAILPTVTPATAQDGRWLTMGRTSSGEILSLDSNSVQTKPHAGNWLWFVYRVTGSKETRERVGFTGSCLQGRLTGKPEWYVEATDRNGVITGQKTIKAGSSASQALLTRVCQTGYTPATSPQRVRASAPKTQEICRDVVDIPPTNTTKTVEFKKFGIRIKIPSNYRTMLLNDGAVEIIDPAMFELFRCQARGGKVLFARGYAPFRIRLVPNPQNLPPLVLAQTLRGYEGRVYTYNLDGTKVVIVESESTFSVGAWFTIPGINGVVEMEASCDCETTKEDMVLYLDKTEN